MPIAPWNQDSVKLNAFVSVLIGEDSGRYPSGNSVVVKGSSEAAIIDPSISVVKRGGAPIEIDLVINSHGHEDHMAGNGLYKDAKVFAHHGDLGSVQSLEALMDSYDLAPELRPAEKIRFEEQLHYSPRPDAQGFADGALFDLGGVEIETIALPGHTLGHCGFAIDSVLFCSDIDLTGFGPYYGDVFSSLSQFLESIEKVRSIDAQHYVTFHQKGIVSGKEEFRKLLANYESVIYRRESEIIDFLVEPRSFQDCALKRFIYRPHVSGPYVEVVEHRSAQLHIERLVEHGKAFEVAPGLFQSK